MALRLNGSSSGYVELDVPAAAGSHTLTLPDGGGSSGQYLQTDGSGGLSWAGVTTGKILQVVNAHKTDAESYTPSTTWTDVASLSVSITPSSASNKVYLTATVNAATDVRAHFRILRGSTPIAVGDAAGSRVQSFASDFQRVGGPDIRSASVSWLDSPSTTSATTYKIQVRLDGGGTVYINRPESTIDAGSYGRPVSSLILLEVAA